MTRKQAVLKAIQILEKKKENAQIVEVLNEIYDDLPLAHWSEKTILDAFAEFISENNKLPRHIDLRLSNGLPPMKTLQRIFNITTLNEFEEKYFPCEFKKKIEVPYYWYTTKDFEECFMRNYNTINGGLYVKYNDYDLYREPGTPPIPVIIKNLKCKSYNELLEKVGLKKKRIELTVQSNKRTISNISQA